MGPIHKAKTAVRGRMFHGVLCGLILVGGTTTVAATQINPPENAVELVSEPTPANDNDVAEIIGDVLGVPDRPRIDRFDDDGNRLPRSDRDGGRRGGGDRPRR